MKSQISTYALLLPLALAGAGSALAADAGAAPDATATCSAATLRGTYQFAFEGFTVSGNGQDPFALGGYEVYDGNGHVRIVATSSTNGKISRLSRTTGHYTVEADCTGSVEYADGTHYDQFVAPDGSQLVFVQTDPGTVAAGFEPRVTARRVGD